MAYASWDTNLEDENTKPVLSDIGRIMSSHCNAPVVSMVFYCFVTC